MRDVPAASVFDIPGGPHFPLSSEPGTHLRSRGLQRSSIKGYVSEAGALAHVPGSMSTDDCPHPWDGQVDRSPVTMENGAAGDSIR